MTIGADILLQKLFYTLHALFVLNLGKCVFYCVNSVKVSKIQLSKIVGSRFLRPVEDMLLLRRAVINNILLPLRQLAERHIYAHTHLLAHIGHQRPHEAVPRRNSPLLNRERFIRHKCTDIHRADAACTAAGFAGPLRIKGQLLSRRRIKLRAANRAGQLLAGGNQKRRLQIMSIRAAMAGKTRIHKA